MTTRVHRLRGVLVMVLAASLGACVDTPTTPQPPPAPGFDAVAAVAAVRAAGGSEATELDVRPLRDPRVEDLREQAAALEARRMYRAAADAIDHALTINPDDPALLQERAEAALLLRQLPEADALARRAFAAGSKLGPLCRRHWETIAQVAIAATHDRVVRDGETMAQATARIAGAQDRRDGARQQRDACTVAASPRF